MGLWRAIAFIMLSATAGGCAAVISNTPINVPLAPSPTTALAAADSGPNDPAIDDDVVIGLAFSGGGMRAAAFSFGVLTEMEKARVILGGKSVALLDHVDYVSGVSGGAITAAYFGLKKRAALADFRDKFLMRDAEESLSTTLSPVTVTRALAGGVNDSRHLPRWLDDNLFHGAMLGDLGETRRPRIWINAADIYNRTPFVFSPAAFSAICSDISAYPIAEAVAASAAVPVLFAPVVIKTYPDRCTRQLPEWIARSRRDPRSPPMLRAFANAYTRYRSGAIPYIKLLDGGLVDNFGLSGFTIARLSADTPYGPITRKEAVTLRRVLFIVVDAGRGPSGDWVHSVEGPAAADLVMAAADTAIDASVRASFTAFQATLADWEKQLIGWRCRLSADERARLGAGPGWNCRDVRFRVVRVGFDHFDEAQTDRLNAVPTRFKLSPEHVDLLIAAGAEALRGNPGYQAFLSEVRPRAGKRGRVTAHSRIFRITAPTMLE
jgi:NTE family protein